MNLSILGRSALTPYSITGQYYLTVQFEKDNDCANDTRDLDSHNKEGVVKIP
jgi:hypothetical protein